MDNTLAINTNLDRFGMIVSCLCALHCLAIPLIVLAVPVAASTLLADEMTESVLLLTAVLIGVTSLIPGYVLHHRRIIPAAVFFAASLLILAGRFGFEEGFWLETVFVATGAGLFAVSHFINYRLCKACCKTGPQPS